MAHQVPLSEEAEARDTSHGPVLEFFVSLLYPRLAVVNVVFYGQPGPPDRQWVLIDAAVMGITSPIRGAANPEARDSRLAHVIHA